MDNKEYTQEEIKEARLKEIQKKRDDEVKAFGFANTRRNKRKSKRFYDQANMRFSICTTKFINVFTEAGFSGEDPKVLDAYDMIEKQWRSSARVLISLNEDTFNTSQKRLRFLNRFTEFVESLEAKINTKKEEDKHGPE